MAAASEIAPSEGKTFCLRLMTLIVDGGSYVLRHLFDQNFPPSSIKQKLQEQAVKQELVRLQKTAKILSQKQYNLLFPAIDIPNSAQFDITLLACLLQSICGLDKNSPAWSGNPAAKDISVEADIVRIRNFRNKLFHRSSIGLMTEKQFLKKWDEIQQVILRLGAGIADLPTYIQRLKESSLDPACEQKLKDEIQQWKEMDEAMLSDISEIKSHLQKHKQDICEVKKALEHQSVDTDNIFETIKKHDHVLSNIAEETQITKSKLHSLEVSQQSHEAEVVSVIDRMVGIEIKVSNEKKQLEQNKEDMHEKFESIDTRLEQTETKTDNLKMSVDKMKLNEFLKKRRAIQARCMMFYLNKMLILNKDNARMSSELRSLASISKMHLQDASLGKYYIKTKAHEEAKKKLRMNGVVILSGCPGEGKTSMAKQLICEITSINKCIILRSPCDWTHFDINNRIFDTIFADDIFGHGVLDETLVKQWERYLPDIDKAVNKCRLKAVITTRHYILEDAKQTLRRFNLFKPDKVQILRSSDLTLQERLAILEAHLNKEDKKVSTELIMSCASASMTLSDLTLVGIASLGFPEIVSMFVTNDELFERQEKFFLQPIEFFKTCIEDLSKDEEKFLALIIIWSRENQSLSQSDLEDVLISKEIAKISSRFGFKSLKDKHIRTLQKSLDHHKDGFLLYNSQNGEYIFNHNIIEDMVGVVAGKYYPEAVIEFGSRAFILSYITTNQVMDDDYHVFIDESRYSCLCKKLLQFLMSSSSNPFSIPELFELKRTRLTPNDVKRMNNGINTWILRHDAFQNILFVSRWLDTVANLGKLDQILSPVLKISGCFISYGITLNETNVYLPSCSIFHSDETLFKECLKRKLLPDQIMEKEFSIALLIATHLGKVDVVKFLISQGIQVNEDAIYVAALNENIELLEVLLTKQHSSCVTKQNNCSRIINGNSPLIIATKKGLEKSVDCLLKYGVDVNYRNTKNMSALDKAVIYDRVNICKLLLEKGANVNIRCGKFKRTPLHVAADKGLVDIILSLLAHGASVYVKDLRRHYPIHCAAICNKTDAVKCLLTHDKSQAYQRIISYGTQSFIKGMTIFHIAVWKNNSTLIDLLLEMKVDPNISDCYGRTPFYQAVFCGNKRIVEKLLDKVDITKAEKNGFTPLHAAIHTRQTEIAKLICARVDVNVQDRYGKTPLHVACELFNAEIINTLLEQCHADPYIQTKTKKTVLKYLRKYISISSLDSLAVQHQSNKDVPTCKSEKETAD